MALRISTYLNMLISRPLTMMSRACLAFALQVISQCHFCHASVYQCQCLVLQPPSILSQLRALLSQHSLAPPRPHGSRSPHLKVLGVRMRMKRWMKTAEMKVQGRVAARERMRRTGTRTRVRIRRTRTRVKMRVDSDRVIRRWHPHS
jgi:hypothetical protein